MSAVLCTRMDSKTGKGLSVPSPAKQQTSTKYSEATRTTGSGRMPTSLSPTQPDRLTWTCSVSKYERGGYRVDFDSRDAAEKSAKTAARVVALPIRVRRVVISGEPFLSFDAHRLLDVVSEADQARPGHPCG